MSIEMSKKIILITEKPRISPPIKIALNSLGYELASDYPALTSISVMRTGIAKSGKTAFIRTALLRFIKEYGFPKAIIMDCQIDLGPGSIQDPEMLKIFKTFMIAYIILRKGVELKHLKGNFILLTKGNSFEQNFGLGENPHNVMNLIYTQNPEINVFIDELKNRKERFDELFSIILLDSDLPSNVITDTVARFLVDTSQNAPVKNPETVNTPTPDYGKTDKSS